MVDTLAWEDEATVVVPVTTAVEVLVSTVVLVDTLSGSTEAENEADDETLVRSEVLVSTTTEVLVVTVVLLEPCAATPLAMAARPAARTSLFCIFIVRVVRTGGAVYSR